MLDKSIRVLNFDNSVIQQAKLLSQYQAEIIDFTGFASSARLYMSGVLRKRIADYLAPQKKKYATFLGSGDFHHISEIITSQIDQPFCLIVFDFHPDWDTLPPRFGCGSWVSQALKNKNILKVLLLGIGSQDLCAPSLETGNLAALADNRLEIYPYRRKPSRVYFKCVPENYSIITRKVFFSSKIIWHELEKENLSEFTLNLIKQLPVQKIYISIDKDCLTKESALTNWEEGALPLDQLLTMVKLMRKNLDIIGLDVVGDYSVPAISDKLKGFFSRLDHPKWPVVNNYPAEEISRLNEQTNLKILQEIFS